MRRLTNIQIDPESGGKDWFAARHDPSEGPSGSVLRLVSQFPIAFHLSPHEWARTDCETTKLHYPAVAMDEAAIDTTVDIRAGAHSDYGSLTLLFQRASQPGLEILTPKSSWSPVPVSPPGTEDDPFPPVLVNIGDVCFSFFRVRPLETLSKHLLQSEFWPFP